MHSWISRFNRISQKAILLGIVGIISVPRASGADEQVAPPPASPQLKLKAEHGFVRQEVELAEDYLCGNGVPKDKVQAAQWFRKAADQGEPTAQTVLAYMYLAGIGVAKDPDQAALWDIRAASSGYAPAKVNLATMYLHGVGVKLDSAMALRLLKEAAARQDGRADAYLGMMYSMGFGVPVDLAQAESWFKKGAKRHSPEAEYGLANLYSGAQGHALQLDDAVALFRMSAGQGYVISMHSLGLLLVNHPDLQREQGEELRSLTSASQAGWWQSSAVLGILARDGKFLPKDLAAAYCWFQIARLQGGSAADSYLHTSIEEIGRRLGPNDQAASNQNAEAWIASYPTRDIFVSPRGIGSGFFPVQEVYAASQAPLPREKPGATN